MSALDSRDRSPVEIAYGRVHLNGDLVVPASPLGLVLFAHGSGSSRFSPRNRFVAEVLNDAGIATLLLDLLTEDESAHRDKVFDITLLAQRLGGATAWCRRQNVPTRIGYFGASTGAAAALVAAAEPIVDVKAIVSRGGRPDLAWTSLREVSAPTLLIVGSHDEEVLSLNELAAGRMSNCHHELSIVPGASHLFEEPGTLDAAAALARDWFVRHLSPLATAS